MLTAPLRNAPLASLLVAAPAPLLAASPASAQVLPPPVQQGDLTVRLVVVAEGLTAPNLVTHAGDDSGRLFVVDQIGLVRVIDASGNLLAEPFLDVRDRMVTLAAGFDERGLLGLAFHPDFESNGRFFVRYSVPRAGSAGEPCFGTSRGCHSERLSEFTMPDPTASTAAAAVERVLFEIAEPEFNHNSGSVEFGPDGMLYFTLGDGGGANDGLSSPGLPHGPDGNGQNTMTHLGSMLRIDVDAEPEPGLGYAIPGDNPFAAPRRDGLVGLPEIYAWGFRNPFRFSFDDETGELWVADVGQNLIEEIDVVEGGRNYGWVIREGSLCFDPQNPGDPLPACPGVGLQGEPLHGPVAEYTHADGISVIGGYVWRRSAGSAMHGKYIFGDFSTSFGSPAGRLFYLDAEGDRSAIFEPQLEGGGVFGGRFIRGFGRDEAGHVYVATTTVGGTTGATGAVIRIDPTDLACSPADVSAPLGQLTVNDLLAYLGLFRQKAPEADLDGSGQVEVHDLLAYLGAFRAGCP